MMNRRATDKMSNPYGTSGDKLMRLIRDSGILVGFGAIIWLNTNYGSAEAVAKNTTDVSKIKSEVSDLKTDVAVIKQTLKAQETMQKQILSNVETQRKENREDMQELKRLLKK